MREYDRSESRWREEDLDEYGFDRYDGYAEEVGAGDEYYDDEGEEEEEEPQQPTQEEMEFLSTREKLKEKIRQKLRKETSAALGKSGPLATKKLPSTANSEFGSFFGPSRPAVSRRVIEERHAILETQHIRSKEPSSTTSDVKRVVASAGHEGKNNVSHERPKVSKEVKSKAQALKDIRDYSFLFEDSADLPDPAKDKAPKKPSVHSDIHSVEASRPKVPAIKPLVSGPSVRDKKVGGPSGHNMLQARMQTSMNGLMPSSGSRSLPGGNVGNGSSRPVAHKVTSSGHHQNSTVKKSITTVNDKPASIERKSSAVKPDTSQKRVPDPRESREPPKSKVMGQQASSSRPPLSSLRPPLPSSSRPPSASSSSRPPLPPSRPQQSSTRLQQPTSSSRPQQPTSSSRPQQLTSSSRLQQLTSSSRPQLPASYKSQQSTSSSRPQEKVPSRPQLQTASRPPQTSSSKPQQQMASRPHQSISSRPAQNMPSSKVQPSSSKPQMSKPFKSMNQQRPQENRLKKRPASYSDEDEDEDAKALSMLRRLTGYNPRRFADDDDDSDMEATFDDIMDEEFRSEQIGAKEDEEQLRLIQQEEEEERLRMMRKMAKKRKLR